MVSAKRKREDDAQQLLTPRKLRAQAVRDNGSEEENETVDSATPSRYGRGQQAADGVTPRSILKKRNIAPGLVNGTPKSTRKLVFDLSTPTKVDKNDTPTGLPIVRNADRSARRKSNRKLIERAINGDESDEDAEEDEKLLAQQILSDADEAEVDHDTATVEDADLIAVPDTPSKRGRGRPKGSGKGKAPGRSQKQRSPTPPQDLPPHEEYFWQNRPKGNKTSDNTLPSQSLLNHDEYFQAMQSYEDPHKAEMDFLLELHGRAYDQWIFELQEGFNICLFGYGSKRGITKSFTAHLYEHLLGSLSTSKKPKETPKIIVINGYSSGTSIKEILNTLASVVMPTDTKAPNQPASLLSYLLHYMTEHPPRSPIPIILNSIDSQYLRKSPAPSILAALAAHPSINLVCTADTPNFPLLWDVGLKAQYRFLFHDATTFAPYEAEIDVVESVNELLDRSGRRVGGRDGVGFVLRSLPENARSLFRIIVTEQLAIMFEDADVGQDDPTATPHGKKTGASRPTGADGAQGVEYRVLYHKAVEEFVCSSEVGFRTLLKEFHDHQMIESKKDAMGTERLWVPFRQEELEGLAEDLSGDAF